MSWWGAVMRAAAAAGEPSGLTVAAGVALAVCGVVLLGWTLGGGRR